LVPGIGPVAAVGGALVATALEFLPLPLDDKLRITLGGGLALWGIAALGRGRGGGGGPPCRHPHAPGILRRSPRGWAAFSCICGRNSVADIAIDLGTANTLVHVRGQGVVLNEPSVVAVERGTGRVRAIGLEAKRMLGRTPEAIVAVRPMRDGVIADVDMAEIMLRHFLQLVLPRGLFRARPQVVVGVPSGITEMERPAVRSAAVAAGAKEAYPLPEPMAAAAGAGLPVATPRGRTVATVRGGTTEIGVIALSGIGANSSIRVGGNELDEAITAFVRKGFNLLIGDATSESIKIQIGSAYPDGEEREMPVKGRDLVSGIPKTVVIGSAEIRDAIQEPIQAIVEAVRRA